MRPCDAFPAEGDASVSSSPVPRETASRSGDAETATRALPRNEENTWILPARVPLFTSKGQFCVNLTLGGRDDGFWPPINCFPQPSQFQWSDWLRTNKGRDKPADAAATMYRFRFEQAPPPG